MKKLAIPYQLFRWGPCLVKLEISEENRLLLLKEAKASKTDFETRLAGIVNKQVAFRDYKMFEEFFSKIFELYADALQNGRVTIALILNRSTNSMHSGLTFKDRETLIHRTIMVDHYLGLFSSRFLKY